MDFYQPLALFGLLSLPIILIMHLLKQKHKVVSIPSLYLWKEVLAQRQAASTWQKLKKSLLLFLQLAATALLVFSIAGPYVPGMTVAENTILVLDCSMSMKAVDTEPSRFEKAREAMASTIRNAKGSTRFSIIAATSEPYIVAGFTEDKNSLLKQLNQLMPFNAGIDADGVTRLVQMLGKQAEAEVYVFTDGGLRLDEVQPSYVSVGGPVDNTAITLISHALDDDGMTVLVKVKNYGERVVKNAVALYADDKIADIREFTAEPDEEKELFFIRLPVRTGRLTAKLETPDLFHIDDAAYDVVTDAQKEKVLLTTEVNVFLENALALMPNIVLYKNGMEGEADDKGYYLYVYDGVLPDVLPSDGHLLVINPPEGNSFLQIGGEVSIDKVSIKNRRLMSFIPQFDFSLLKTKEMAAPDWADVLLDSPQTPIIFAGEESGRKVTVIGFDFHHTDLVLKKEFPIFIYNLLQWFIPGEVTGRPRNVTHDAITFQYAPDADEIDVVTPSGDIHRLAPPFPPDVFTQTDEPGFYTLRQLKDGESRYATFSVGLGHDESDLRGSVVPQDDQPVQTERTAGTISLRPFLILFLLILLTIEWWVYIHGTRV